MKILSINVTYLSDFMIKMPDKEYAWFSKLSFIDQLKHIELEYKHELEDATKDLAMIETIEINKGE